MLRKTKVVATIGPACAAPDTLAKMMRAGMNVARFNMSHGDHASHRKMIDLVRRVAAEHEENIAIMLDTKGVEVRTGVLENDEVRLETGRQFTLYTDDRKGNEKGVAVSYRDLPNDVAPGDALLVDDGKLQLCVLGVNRAENSIACEVVIGGVLRDRKGINVPGINLKLSVLSGDNREDLLFAADAGVDYIAASFVRYPADIIAIRSLLEGAGAKIPILAKIESLEGVQQLQQIVDVADGTMVARGDLGVELPLEEVPHTQKKIIHTTVTSGKPVITATQMLDSMERNPSPTRAEVSDVANAILDGTSAVMLSGETAAGKYPVRSVETMVRVAREAENHLQEYGHLQHIHPPSSDVTTDAVCRAAITMADSMKAQSILTLTESGQTSRTVSKYRPNTPILAVTRSRDVMRKLAMNWGVSALCIEHDNTVGDDEVICRALRKAVDLGNLAPGDKVVATLGNARQPGSTNMIKVYEAPGA